MSRARPRRSANDPAGASAPSRHARQGDHDDLEPVCRVSQFVEIARPKVNLTLHIFGKRADGYHALQSLVAFAQGPCDRLTLDCVRPREVAVTGPFAGGIAGINLLETTLEMVAQATAAAPDAASLSPHALRFGHVHLEKNLPVAAGIGGGSADAGALLRAIRRANPELTAVIEWNGIARRLGADVPVCLLNEAAWMTGIGECLAPLRDLPALSVVLVNPMVPVPANKTAQVFCALAAPPLPSHHAELPPPVVPTRDALIDLVDGGNDLERAAIKVMPEIAHVLDALRATLGCRVAAMSGAGPTCFGVFDDVNVAAERLAKRHTDWWVAPAILS